MQKPFMCANRKINKKKDTLSDILFISLSKKKKKNIISQCEKKKKNYFLVAERLALEVASEDVATELDTALDAVALDVVEESAELDRAALDATSDEDDVTALEVASDLLQPTNAAVAIAAMRAIFFMLRNCQ